MKRVRGCLFSYFVICSILRGLEGILIPNALNISTERASMINNKSLFNIKMFQHQDISTSRYVEKLHHKISIYTLNYTTNLKKILCLQHSIHWQIVLLVLIYSLLLIFHEDLGDNRIPAKSF